MKIKCPDCGTSYEIKTEAVGAEGRSVKCAKCGNRWFVSPEAEETGEIGAEAAEDGFEADGTDAAAEKDEAEWQADAAAEDAEPAPEADTPAPPAPASDAETGKFAKELADEPAEATPADIETLAKRPKIIVNPNKFRRNHIGAILGWLFRRNFRRIVGILLFGAAVTICATMILLRDNMVKQSPDLASLFQMIGFDVNLRGLEFRNLRIFTEVEEGKRVLVVEGSIRNLLEERNTVPAVRLSIRSSDQQEVYAWTVEPRTRSLNALDETRFRTILADPPDNASDIQVRFVERGKRQIVLE